MTLKTKALLNLIVSVIFTALTVIHIYDGKSFLRLCGDVIPALWFGAVGVVYSLKAFKKQRKTNNRF